MEQNREPRNKPIFLWSINIQQGGRSIIWSKNSLFNKSCWESWIGTCKKNETRPPAYTIHQDKLKTNKRFEYNLSDHKSPKGKHRQ